MAIHPGPGPHVGGGDQRIVEQLLHLFQAGQDFDQPRQVIQEGGGHHPSAPLAQFLQFLVGPSAADVLAQVQSGEGAHPVAAGLGAEGLEIREFQIAPRFHGFRQELLHVVLLQAVGHQGAVAGHHADATAAAAAVVLPAAVLPH